MAKLYFRYGAMGSSKTANALMVAYNYRERGKLPLLAKPKIDTREIGVMHSRIGLEQPCIGITIVLAGITLICSMNQEKIGFKVLLIGGVMAGVGLVGIVYLLFGIVPAIIAGLACVLYAIVMILTS